MSELTDLVQKAAEMKSRATEVEVKEEEFALPLDVTEAVEEFEAIEELVAPESDDEVKAEELPVEEVEVKAEDAEEAIVENSDSDELEVEADADLPEEKSIPEAEVKAAYRPSLIVTKGHDPMNKEFELFLRGNKESKFMNETTLSEGGYLVHEEFYNQIIGKLVERNTLRTLATTIAISGKALEIDRTGTHPSVFWTAEGGTKTASDAAFQRISIAAHSLTAELRLTQELLEDASYDVVGALSDMVVEEFAAKEALAFVAGTGVGQPEGLLTASGTVEVTSGSAADFGPEDLSRMLEQFKYNDGVFMMNRATFEKIRRFVGTTNDHFLNLIDQNVAPTGQAAYLGRIHSVPVLFTPELESAGANKYPIVLADLKKAYAIVDRKAMTLRLDDLTLLSEGKVKIVAHRRVGGAVIRPDAVVKLKCAV